MSRIGKLPIIIPKDINITYDGVKVMVKGKYGTLSQELLENITILQTDDSISIILKDESLNYRDSSFRGLFRTLISNMIIGVCEQFDKTLVMIGIGYRAVIDTNNIVLYLGYSYPIKFEIPQNISVEIIQNTTIILKSCDRAQLGLFAATIRQLRLPEPYKGKGILYKHEIINRKPGKSGK